MAWPRVPDRMVRRAGLHQRRGSPPRRGRRGRPAVDRGRAPDRRSRPARAIVGKPAGKSRRHLAGGRRHGARRGGPDLIRRRARRLRPDARLHRARPGQAEMAQRRDDRRREGQRHPGRIRPQPGWAAVAGRRRRREPGSSARGQRAAGHGPGAATWTARRPSRRRRSSGSPRPSRGGVEVWRKVGFAIIATAWTERAYGLGEPCTARLPNETMSGLAEGLDADGALRLRLADGSIRRITAGDVFFEGA